MRKKNTNKTVTKHFMRSKALSDQHHHRKNVEDFHAIVTELSTWSRLAWQKQIEQQNLVFLLWVFVILEARHRYEVRRTNQRQVHTCVFVEIHIYLFG